MLFVQCAVVFFSFVFVDGLFIVNDVVVLCVVFFVSLLFTVQFHCYDFAVDAERAIIE